MTEDQSRLEARQFLQDIKDDFIHFTQALWEDRRYERVAPLGRVELDIMRYIATGPKLRGVLAPRSVGKSYFGTCALACWKLYQDPETRVIIASKKFKFAAGLVKQVRQWINEVWFLQHLIPPDNKLWSDAIGTGQFDVRGCEPTKDPSVSAVGVDGSVTGSRGHLVIADDVEAPENTKTVNARQQLDEKVQEFKSVATYGAGEIVYIGTYHHEDSLYLKLPERGYAFRAWPLEYPKPDEHVPHLAPMIARDLEANPALARTEGFISPTIGTRPNGSFGRDYILERRAEGASYYARQHMLIARVPDALRYPLKLSDLVVMDCQGEIAPVSVAWGRTNDKGHTEVNDIEIVGWTGDTLHHPAFMSREVAPWEQTYMRIDPSGRGADQTAWGVMSALSGRLWLRLLRGDGHQKEQSGSDESILREIAKDARRMGVHTVRIERDFGGDTFADVLRPILEEHYTPDWSCALETMPAIKTMKETRIIGSLEPVMNNHRLVADPSCLRPTAGLKKEYELQWQIAAMCEERDALVHDDKVEVLGELVADFQRDVAIDASLAAANAIDAQRMQTRSAMLRDRYVRPEIAGPTSTLRHRR